MRSPVEEFLGEQSLEIQADFASAVSALEQGFLLSMPLSRNLSSIALGLQELRLKDRHGIYRFFYFIKKSDGIYFLHGFKKKSQELPKTEIEKIQKRLREVVYAF